MAGSRLSPYPHLSWFANDLIIRPPRVFVLHEYTAVVHRLILTEAGDADLLWTTAAGDLPCQVTGGDLGFFPGDFARHTLAITAPGIYHGHEFLLPNEHVEHVCEAEDIPRMVGLQAMPVFRDALIQACMLRLLTAQTRGRLAEDLGAEIAARQVVIRLSALAGGRLPDWLKDASVFPPPVMRQIVERVDARLHGQPSLDEMSIGFGLSPSHFARKFQKSTGLSLNRFMNRWRIGLSLLLLRTGKESIAQLSLDLGFSSQSHFTRLFSGLTGLTPSRFRQAYRRLSA